MSMLFLPDNVAGLTQRAAGTTKRRKKLNIMKYCGYIVAVSVQKTLKAKIN
jgi:hypothetical protein